MNLNELSPGMRSVIITVSGAFICALAEAVQTQYSTGVIDMQRALIAALVGTLAAAAGLFTKSPREPK